MAQALITVVCGDKNYDLNFTLKDAQGVVLDISAATLQFKAQLQSTLQTSFTGSMSVVTGNQGKCKYTVAETDFPTPGTYNCQIVVTISSQKITFSDIIVEAVARVPVSAS